MTIRINLKHEKKTLHAEQVDLSINGWVIAEVTDATIDNRRWIPRENVVQITSTSDDDIISPPRETGKK